MQKFGYQSDALAGPGAVVVKFVNTVVTDCTMRTPWRSKYLANSAILDLYLYSIDSNSPASAPASTPADAFAGAFTLCACPSFHQLCILVSRDYSWISCPNQKQVCKNLRKTWMIVQEVNLVNYTIRGNHLEKTDENKQRFVMM